jgi:ABC-2 type transport system ATP-binding protein
VVLSAMTMGLRVARVEEMLELVGVCESEAGIAGMPSGDGGLRAECDPIEVGRAAAAAGLVLAELRTADGAGLEELFLQLTADDARETVPTEATTREGTQ